MQIYFCQNLHLKELEQNISKSKMATVHLESESQLEQLENKLSASSLKIAFIQYGRKGSVLATIHYPKCVISI